MSMLVWEHLHIEPSSICTLKCPRCPRAEIPETLLNRQLSLEFFKNQIGQDIIKQVKKITFCGNDGDPIYCKDFTDICKWIKTINPGLSIVIVTNGSYRSDAWWQDLASCLNSNDEVHWSLDGWDQQSNQQYRVNCNWDSIIKGIAAFSKVNSTTFRVWASIGFKFNQDHIETQKQLAKSLNFDLFQLTKSTKFGSRYPNAYGAADALEPTNSNLIASGHRFERALYALSNKTRPGNELKKVFLQRAADLISNGTYSGICLIGNKGLFINSQGEFYPCCWTANRYQHNSSWHALAQSKFNLNNRTFKEIIDDPFWQNDFLKFDSLECITKCTSVQLHDTNHTTEW